MMRDIKRRRIARIAISTIVGALLFLPFIYIWGAIPGSLRGLVENLVLATVPFGSIFWVPIVLTLLSTVFFVKDGKEGAVVGWASLFLSWLIYREILNPSPLWPEADLSVAGYSILGAIGGAVGGAISARKAKHLTVDALQLKK